MMPSTFPPKPVIFTTHSPWTKIVVPPPVASLMVIVPVTFARSVMLLTVWNVCVNGRAALRALREGSRVHKLNLLATHDGGGRCVGASPPGTVLCTTSTRPLRTVCDTISLSSVPSFRICKRVGV